MTDPDASAPQLPMDSRGEGESELSATQRLRQQRLRAEYTARINRVIDYIGAHLTDELKLEPLAKLASFSPYHFHRLFAALTGETLGQFVTRLRLERAATQLRADPSKPVTEVALDCGYASSASFSRAFRAAFRQTPSEWRDGDSNLSTAASKYGMPKGSLGEDSFDVRTHSDPHTNRLRWRISMNTNATKKLEADVHVSELPEVTVAYLRHIGPYAGDAQLFERLFGKLMSWAGARDLLGPQARMMCLYHDDPSVTEESKLRVDCCLSVAPDTAVDGEVGKQVVPAGKYAVARFELAMDQYSEAWQTVMGGWMPESGYQPADGPCCERYLNDPSTHPEGKCIVELLVPVKPL
jgi:AraC family transcriptional regulator